MSILKIANFKNHKKMYFKKWSAQLLCIKIYNWYNTFQAIYLSLKEVLEMTNYCHLSYEDRKNIEDGLNENKSINQIANEINRSHTSVLREIDRNKVYSVATAFVLPSVIRVRMQNCWVH